MNSIRRRFVIWHIVVAALLVLLAWELKRGVVLDTNILALLPRADRNPVVSEALRIFTEHAGRNVVFLVGHTDEKKARAAAVSLANALSYDAFESVLLRVDREMEVDFFQMYFPYRHQFLSPQVREMLGEPGGADRFLEQSKRALYGPISGFYSGLLKDDPLLLFPIFVQSLPRPTGGAQVRDGMLMVDAEGRHYVMITARIRGSAFARTSQRTVSAAISKAIHRAAEDHPGVEIVSTGVVRFAEANASATEREISAISTGSVIGIFLLMVITFRSIRQWLLSFLPAMVGLLAAFTISVLAFGQIHLITLGFGSSLVGICTDYSLHYFAEQLLGRSHWNSERILRHIFPGITLGAITTIMGYMGLWVAPFPGLRQMALFSCAGILGAYGTVVCWFPVWAGSSMSPRKSFILVAAQHFLRAWHRANSSGMSLAIIAASLAIGGLGIMRLKFDDDVRSLQHGPLSLVQQDHRVRSLVGGEDTRRILVLEGASPEEVLARQEAIGIELDKFKEVSKIGQYMSLGSFLPSSARQSSDLELLRSSLLADRASLDRYMHEMGFSAATASGFVERLERPIEPGLTLERWLDSPVSSPLRHLWLGATSKGYAAIVMLENVRDAAALRQWAATRPGVHFVDLVNDMSNLFRRYRQMASRLVMFSYLAIYALLAIRYGAMRGTLIILPAFLAAILTLACMGFAGAAVNIFTMLALLLVLGLGIDYTIFLAEAESESDGTMMAILFSTLTTILSFGLLSFSKTPVLHALGLAVLLGILFATILAPLAQIKFPGRRAAR